LQQLTHHSVSHQPTVQGGGKRRAVTNLPPASFD
jgi:hypothetical protein